MISPIRTRPAIVPDSPPMIARFRPVGMASAMPPIVALLVGSAFRTALLPLDGKVEFVLGPDELATVEDGTTHVVGDLLMVEFAGSEEFPETVNVECRCDDDFEDVVPGGTVADVIHCVVVGR